MNISTWKLKKKKEAKKKKCYHYTTYLCFNIPLPPHLRGDLHPSYGRGPLN